ncbi:MAG TPA: family 10 glycosylhydrolase [Firmicutes bacterium]|nr:family 10 glycosylhydrolase [Bacillota bacterium]
MLWKAQTTRIKCLTRGIVAPLAVISLAMAVAPVALKAGGSSSSPLPLPPAASDAWRRIQSIWPELAELAAEAPAWAIVGAVAPGWEEDWQRAQNLHDRLATSLAAGAASTQPPGESLADAVYQLEAEIPVLYTRLLPSRSVEIRILPVDAGSFTQFALAGNIDLLVRMAKSAGFNAIFLETLRDDGYLVYPSTWGEEAPELAATRRDAFAELIEEAHNESIAVFPWIKLLFATANGELGPVISKHPDWAAVQQNGKIQTVPYNFVWFNPAHPEVRDFLTSQIKDLAERYEIDGIQLDYVRYPNNYGTDLDYSYDPVTIEQFKQLYGFDPKQLPPIPAERRASSTFRPDDLPEEYQSWNAFRQEIITSLLTRVVREARAVRPGLPVSVAPFVATWGGGTYQQALLWHQNWPVWLERRLPNLLSPLTYTDRAAVLDRELSRVEELAHGRAIIAPSLSVSAANDSEWGSLGLLQQIRVVQRHGAAGYRVFAFPHLRADNWYSLRTGPFRRPALNPVLQPAEAVATLLEEFTTLLQEIERARGEMSQAAAEMDETDGETDKTGGEPASGVAKLPPANRWTAQFRSRLAALPQGAREPASYRDWLALERAVASMLATASDHTVAAAESVARQILLETMAIAQAELWRLRPAGLGYQEN